MPYLRKEVEDRYFCTNIDVGVEWKGGINWYARIRRVGNRPRGLIDLGGGGNHLH